MFELFDHTADLGLRVEAASLEELLAEAGAGLLAILVANPQQVRPLQSVELSVPRRAPEDLLFDWLSELLYRYESERLLLCRFELTLGDQLQAVAWGETAGARHELDHEIKAVTYHDLEAFQGDDGRWHGTVIVDI